MLFYLNLASSLSIIFACVIGLSRFKKILKSYRPFVYYATLAFLNEFLSATLVLNGFRHGLNSNIYILVEFILILWQFGEWGVHQHKKLLYQVCGVVLSIVWIWDNLILNSPETNNQVFRMSYSFLLIFLSIDQINHVIVTEKRNILLNARFIICAGFLIFYTFKVLYGVFVLVSPKMSLNFQIYMLVIMFTVNFIVNLIFAYAALWIPTKQRFTLPY